MPRYFSFAATSHSKRRQNSKTKEIVVREAKSLKLLVRVFLVHCLGDIYFFVSLLPSRKLTPWWSLWMKPIYKIITSCYGKHLTLSMKVTDLLAFITLRCTLLKFQDTGAWNWAPWQCWVLNCCLMEKRLTSKGQFGSPYHYRITPISEPLTPCLPGPLTWPQVGKVQNTNRLYIFILTFCLTLDVSKASEVFLLTYDFDPGMWVNKGTGSVRMERKGLVWTFVAPHLGNWIAAPSPSSNGTNTVKYSQITHKL